MTTQQKTLNIMAAGQFAGAVCCVLGEDLAETLRYRAHFKPVADPALSCKELTDAQMRAFLLATAKTAVKLLEGK